MEITREEENKKKKKSIFDKNRKVNYIYLIDPL